MTRIQDIKNIIFAAVKKQERIFLSILALWVCADLLTALFAEIHADEAYYALYGAFLDWGYYDHPPMVALLTRCSSSLFGGNLGVRFCTTLLHAGTLWLIWRTLDEGERHRPHAAAEFCIIAASLTMFVVYGFITTPDAPLLFFTALFFFLYKRYLAHPGWPLATAIGLTVAAMLYSKYMALLVVMFVLLSNLRLLRDGRVWYAAALALLLFTPHLLWQIRHDFPSFSYHLIARNSQFKWTFPLEYIPNQLLVFNPAALVVALLVCWRRRKTSDLWEKAGLFTIAGFLLFFWLMTLKGHAEPHWTVAASVPMLPLLFHTLRQEGWRKWTYRLFLPIAGLLITARIILCFNILPERTGLCGNQVRMEAIHQLAGHTPVIFVGSFQNPALYRFYTGEKTTALSTLYGRRTQYDILQLDTCLQGGPCLLVGNIPSGSDTIIHGTPVHYRRTGHYQGTNRIVLELNQCDFLDGDSVRVHYTLTNTYPVTFDFAHEEFPISLLAVYRTAEGYHKFECPLTENITLCPDGWLQGTASFPLLHNTPMVFALYNGVCETVNSKPHILAP